MYYKRSYNDSIAVLDKTQGFNFLRCNNETTLNEKTFNEYLYLRNKRNTNAI